MASAFYQLTPKQEDLLRARRAELCTSIREADRDGFTLWVLCVWCGHTHITEPRFLIAQVKDAPDLISALEPRLKCTACGHYGTRLIPTDRTMVAMMRMGASARG